MHRRPNRWKLVFRGRAVEDLLHVLCTSSPAGVFAEHSLHDAQHQCFWVRCWLDLRIHSQWPTGPGTPFHFGLNQEVRAAVGTERVLDGVEARVRLWGLTEACPCFHRARGHVRPVEMLPLHIFLRWVHNPRRGCCWWLRDEVIKELAQGRNQGGERSACNAQACHLLGLLLCLIHHLCWLGPAAERVNLGTAADTQCILGAEVAVLAGGAILATTALPKPRARLASPTGMQARTDGGQHVLGLPRGAVVTEGGSAVVCGYWILHHDVPAPVRPHFLY
mmetsp:Transcript_7333/g.19816  ORF Transcript_7333/g.19816 Transcript_7333/m.19816 type:complete len:278 (+) Transcript_7333:459-1292(+)